MICLLLLTARCGGSDNSETIVSSTEDVTINFAAKAADQPIDCETTLKALGTTQTNGQIKDFRLYLHDLTLIAIDGSEYPLQLAANDWQTERVALLDFQNKSDNCSGDTKETHSTISGKLDSGVRDTITAIHFKLGVPAELNHSNQASAVSPLNITSLFWSWQAGYKFVRFDFAPTNGITRPDDDSFFGTSFNFHLGSTDCAGDPTSGETVNCGRSNRPSIKLDDYSLDDTIVIDYAELVSTVDLSADQGGAVGCMGGKTDPECASMFERLGLDIETGEVSGAISQTVFSIEPK
jgi:uncharacterized repeat protein (TIGR04052 family)